MLKMKTLALGAYQTNTYLVWEENSPTCVVIDSLLVDYPFYSH